MSVLLLNGLRKILGAQEILRGVDLRVDNGEKVGVVGRNGEGKTTLLRLLTDEEHPDGGSIQLAKGARLGYVTQRAEFEPGVSARAYVESGLAEVHAVEAELVRVGEEMARVEGEALDQLVRRHGELTARMEFLGGWEADRKVETVLDGIGLARRLWEREANTLSGGEKARTQMARELVSVPDLLLLDEPTNHLDLAGIEWLEAWLKELHSAVLMVSHDRRMLDRVVDTIVEVERGQLVRYPGNYSRYVELKRERFEAALRAYEQQQGTIRKEETFIKKHMGSQRTGEAKGRRKRLSSVERQERPYNDVRKPAVRLPKVERGGEQVLEALGLRVGYGKTIILDGVDVRIGRGERLGLVGPNGAGKSTLLRVLAGRDTAQAGEIKRGYRAVCGYFDQETSDLREDGTVYMEIRRDHPRMTDQEIRSHLARFLFRGEEEIGCAVKNLSGGERARLSLARLVLSGPSWLALDEPTNHLDLAGRTALEEMLAEFPGALAFVSHDRQFLDDLATRIIAVEDGGVRSFPGNYTDYRNALLAEAGDARAALEGQKRRAEENKKRAEERARKESTKARPARGKGAKAAKRPNNPWRLKQLEEAIMALEAKREELLASLSSEATYKDPDASREAQFQLAELERDLDDKNTEWESMIG